MLSVPNIGEIRLSALRAERISLLALVGMRWVVSAAILLDFSGVLNVGEFLELGGGTLCHHEQTRCFIDSEGPWAVCARCSEMYLGWILAMMLGSGWFRMEACNDIVGVVFGFFS